MFPDRFREDYAERNLEIGCVIRKFVQFTIPPKEKRFIVVAFTEDKIALAAVLINTSVNENVNYTADLKSLHIPLDHNGRSYLDHASFIDCSELYEESVSILKSALKVDPGCLLGNLSEADLVKTQRLIAQSPSIKPYKKKRFGFI